MEAEAPLRTSVEYLPISALSLAEYSLVLTAPFLANSVCNNFVSHAFYIWSFSWYYNKISFDGKETFGLSFLFKYCGEGSEKETTVVR